MDILLCITITIIVFSVIGSLILSIFGTFWKHDYSTGLPQTLINVPMPPCKEPKEECKCDCKCSNRFGSVSMES